MENYPDFTLGIALMKLEEELNLLRQIVFRLPENLSTEETYNLLNRGLMLLRVSSDLLSGLSAEEGEGGWVKDISFGVFEALFITHTIFEKLEKKLPLFFDEVKVFEEPALQKLKQVIDTLHSFSGETRTENPVDFEELSYILQEITRTLEVEIARSKLLKEKVL